MDKIIIKVPGNLLLFGEYAVTLPGGKGIAAATDPLAFIQAHKADKLCITCKFYEEEKVWNEDLELINCIIKNITAYLGSKPLPSLNIHIDTSKFYYADGRKKGFGSSAAVTAGLTYLFLQQANLEPPRLLGEVFPLALAAHRDFQGGRGSGYDIAASLFGGVGLFRGGILPQWQTIFPLWVDSLNLIQGDEAVSTKDAVARFAAYNIDKPSQTKQFFDDSNRLVEQLAASRGIDQAKSLFEKGAFLNNQIHQELGIPSQGPKLFQLLEDCRKKGCPGKPLGAGGEIAAVLIDKPHLRNELAPLKISLLGLRCE